MLAEKYNDRIEKIFARYPDKRSAVMPLLYLAQEEYGWLTPEAMSEIAALCEIDRTQVNSIAGFYTMYRESPKGKYWLHVCTDLPCALRGADQFYKDLLDYLGIESGGTSGDNMFTAEPVMCLAACDHPQVLQCNFHYHENLDMASVKSLIEQWRNQREAEPVAAGQPTSTKKAKSSTRSRKKASSNGEE